ncbi:MAG: hypothetical protein H6958_03585 [Chromatiaceae bacterium]|nr:hypothetical protein [Chromatiaceae bacterium]
MDPLTQQLMQRAWSAEKLRQQKATIKRIVTTLRKQSSELGPLLDDDERAALDNAARVLDRWTGKAERAFKAKHRTEQEEHKRQEQRRNRTLEALRARYGGDSLDEQIRHACAMAKLDGYSSDIPGSLRNAMRWIENATRTRPRMDAGRYLRNELKDCVNEGMRSIADTIAYRTEPVADLLHKAFERLDGTIVRDNAETRELITEVRAFLVRQQIVQANKGQPQSGT